MSEMPRKMSVYKMLSESLDLKRNSNHSSILSPRNCEEHVDYGLYKLALERICPIRTYYLWSR